MKILDSIQLSSWFDAEMSDAEKIPIELEWMNFVDLNMQMKLRVIFLVVFIGHRASISPIINFNHRLIY